MTYGSLSLGESGVNQKHRFWFNWSTHPSNFSRPFSESAEDSVLSCFLLLDLADDAHDYEKDEKDRSNYNHGDHPGLKL